jgi:hypothetical protein
MYNDYVKVWPTMDCPKCKEKKTFVNGECVGCTWRAAQAKGEQDLKRAELIRTRARQIIAQLFGRN